MIFLYIKMISKAVIENKLVKLKNIKKQKCINYNFEIFTFD